MVNIGPLTAVATVCLVAASISSVEAQNGAVHAANIPTAPTTKPATPVKQNAGATTASAAAPKPAAAPAAPVPATGQTKPSVGAPGAAKPAAGAAAPAKQVPAAAQPPAASPLPAGAKTPPASSANSGTWFSNFKAKPTDTACYRRAAFYHNKECPVGFNYDHALTCWSQCPIEYPVQCGMECLPQGKDCTLDILTKMSAVANVALNAASGGFFGELTTAAKGVQIGVACAQKVYDVTQKVMGYLDDLQTQGKLTTREEVKILVDKTDFVVYDLPVAVATCIGVDIPKALDTTNDILGVVKPLVIAIIDGKFSKTNLKDKLNFVKMFKKVSASTTTTAQAGAKKLPDLTDQDIQGIISAGTTCGGRIKDFIGQVKGKVLEIMHGDPKTPLETLQFLVLNSPLILKELPDATTGCWEENAPDGVKSSGTFITAVQIMVDKVIASAFDPKKVLLDIKKYHLVIAQLSLDAIAIFDPTGIAAMVRKFLMPMCKTTGFQAPIADGPADKALGMETDGKAFEGATGTWKAVGDKMLTITFTSKDKYPVKVNIRSGGKKEFQVEVPVGQVVTFKESLDKFSNKTLYLDRWRKGLFGIPGKGGGSLALWVPNNAAGSLHLDVPIIVTHFFDKDPK